MDDDRRCLHRSQINGIEGGEGRGEFYCLFLPLGQIAIEDSYASAIATQVMSSLKIGLIEYSPEVVRELGECKDDIQHILIHSHCQRVNIGR